MHQPDLQRTRGVDAFSGLKITLRLARTNGTQHVRTDGGRDQAELHFGGREHRRLGCHRDVAGTGQTHAAAQRRAVHARDRGFGKFGQSAQHPRQRVGIGQILLVTVACGATHPVQIAAGGKTPAAASQHHDAHRLVRAQCAQAISDRGDQVFVKGVVLVGPIQPQRGNHAVAFDFDQSTHHITS